MDDQEKQPVLHMRRRKALPTVLILPEKKQKKLTIDLNQIIIYSDFLIFFITAMAIILQLYQVFHF